MAKAINLNFYFECKYCGNSGFSNKRTKMFCSDTCRAKYHNFNNRIRQEEKWNPILKTIYAASNIKDQYFWSLPYSIFEIKFEFNYFGPLPNNHDIMYVGNYQIKKTATGGQFYKVRPKILTRSMNRVLI